MVCVHRMPDLTAPQHVRQTPGRIGLKVVIRDVDVVDVGTSFNLH